MGDVVKFKASGKEYALSIQEHEGGRWVSAQQVGEAIGNEQYRRFIFEQKEQGEMQEGKHYRSVTERQPGDTQARVRLYLSHRGVIRFAMKSKGTRARQFRDWAEEVLYQVMTVGHYEQPVVSRPSIKGDLERMFNFGMNVGIGIGRNLQKVVHHIGLSMFSKYVHFRGLGLSPREAAAAARIDPRDARWAEEALKGTPLELPKVDVKARDRSIKKSAIRDMVSKGDEAIGAISNINFS